MTWTTAKPAKPGAYWYRSDITKIPTLRYVNEYSDSPEIAVLDFGVDECEYLTKPGFISAREWKRLFLKQDIHGEWFGPIEEPE